jgi:hypothetical protein
VEAVKVHFHVRRHAKIADEANGVGGNVEEMRFEAVHHFEGDRKLRRMREPVISHLTKVLQTPLPFFVGSHSASEVSPTGVIDSAKYAGTSFHTQID